MGWINYEFIDKTGKSGKEKADRSHSADTPYTDGFSNTIGLPKRCFTTPVERSSALCAKKKKTKERLNGIEWKSDDRQFYFIIFIWPFT